MKTAKTPTPKAAPKPLGLPHLRVLAALAKAGKALTRNELAAKTGMSSGWCSVVGHVTESKREEGSLARRGFVQPTATVDGNGRACTVWALTAAGRNAYEAAAAKGAKSGKVKPKAPKGAAAGE
jgi:hypothetical protein